MSSCKYLVIFYAVSAGQNGPNLGADEEQIVLIVYLILDVANNKIIGVHQFPVRPSGVDINENILSEEVTEEYGLTEADIKKASPLDEVIDHFDQVVHDDLGGNLTLVTDGQLHLRQCLFPEVTRKNLSLPSYYQRFHDLRKEYSSAVSCNTSINGVEDMLNDLGFTSDKAPDAAIRQVNNISRILQKLLSDGTRLHEPEPILQTLEQGIRSRGDEVDTNCVVRARGLPWQASDTDIARFFSGLNVAPGGVALCLSAQGRRNGEALVLFENANHRDMALRRHKHHIGNRYIEVYKATGEDFIGIAGGNNSEAKAFLARGGQVIIRMRGLPYDCSAKQVIDFFHAGDDACKVLEEENGVLFVKKPDGRATGDAFVLFNDEGDGEKALQKHKEIIGSRYIELFRSTTAEVQQVLNRSTEPAKHNNVPHTAPLIHTLPPVPPMAVIPQQMITAGVRKDCIRLRGLPYESQVEHILEFLGDHAKNIVYQGVHMVFNAQGQPSGEAFIQMDSEASAFSAANQRHHRYMVFGKKQRYIEVFQCSGEDMSMVLTGGVGGPPPPAVKSPLISPGMLHVPTSQQHIQGLTQVLHDPSLLQGLGQQLALPPPLIMGHPAQMQIPVSAANLLQRPPQTQLLPPGWDITGNVPVMTLPVPGAPAVNPSSPQSPLVMLPRLIAPQSFNPFAMGLPQQRFLMPNQAYGLRFPPPGLPFNPMQVPISAPPAIPGGKRTSEQAFGDSGGYPGLLPPKRPPVMYSHGVTMTTPSTSVGHLLPTPPLPLPPTQPFPSV